MFGFIGRWFRRLVRSFRRSFRIFIRRINRLFGPRWPEGWEDDEIEAKWLLSEPELFGLIDDFPDGLQRYGSRLNVRFDGVARRYVDIYYDTPALDLSKNLHSLRVRVRHSSSPLAANNSFDTLDGPTTSWVADWHRFQYKRQPARREAVWFREEIQTEPRIAGAPVPGFVPPNHPTDEAIVAMQADHPEVDLATFVPILENVAYRYRVEMSLASSSPPLQEMSMDQAKARSLPDGSWERFNEFELEALRFAGGGPTPQTETNVKRLFSLTDYFEVDYSLTRSTKSGLEVPET